MRHVFLACPTYDGKRHDECTLSLMQATRSAVITIKANTDSDLAHGFNVLWCLALNKRAELGITDFAMIHSDVGAQPFWLDLLMEEREKCGADLLSCVIPKKDETGDTSTCYVNREKTGQHCLTMGEVAKLPPTFSVADIGDGYLGANTGLWICDFTKPWVEQVHFEMLNRIGKNEAGEFEAKTLPEDWGFSIQLAELGLKVMATNRLKVSHSGRKTWNSEPS